MDFSKFRETGEFSDIVVVVDKSEYKLHKFPLFAKSDYFCTVVKSDDDLKIELTDFPGGKDMFQVIADFFYNMKIEITKDNIIKLRCGAEYLQMTGFCNLIEMCDKSLKEMLMSAKLSRFSDTAISLLFQCGEYKNIAEKAGIVAVCEDAVVDIWLRRPTRLSAFTSSIKLTDESEDSEWEKLMALPEEWFSSIISKARERGVNQSRLTDMIVKYILCVLTDETDIGQSQEADDQQQKEADDQMQPDDDDNTSSKKENTPKQKQSVPRSKSKVTDLGKVLDKLIPELPEEAYLCDRISIEWVTKVLHVSTTKVCKCRPILVKLARELFSRCTMDELTKISPSVLHEIVAESHNEDPESRERAGILIDNYMAEMSRKGVLTLETYKLLTKDGACDKRKNHDQLYGILEQLLKSDSKDMSDKDRQEIMDTVDFDKVSESTLQKALDNKLVPPTKVAKGALSLCSRLRGELSEAKYHSGPSNLHINTKPETSMYSFSLKKSPDSAFKWRAVLRASDKGYSDNVDALNPNYDYLDTKNSMDALALARQRLNDSTYRCMYRRLASDWDACYEDELDYYYYDRYDRPYRSYESKTRPRSKYSSLTSYSSRY